MEFADQLKDFTKRIDLLKDGIKTEEASLEEISAAMINLAQSKVALGGVLTFVGGIGLIVCMHWLFICLKDIDFTYSKNK